ncbi:MAG: sterol carrier protein domain-containing protein [bacterium]|nr:sterol carrier protein domain-containing protein [bacterium]
MRDSFLPDNDSELIAHFANGTATAKKGADFDCELSIDMADFSSLITGAADFRDLYNYSRATLSDLSCLEDVDSLFRVHGRPICTTAF